MGRLRGGEDAAYFRSINEEVIDLFGNEDGVLHRFNAEGSCPNQDPVWDEPTTKPNYEPFNLPFLIQDWNTPIQVDELGAETIYEATIYISRAHLDRVAVPKDSTGEQIRPGDKFECWHQGDRLYYDIITVNRDGFVNDSDCWSQYVLTCRRTTKYVSEKDI